MTVSDKLQDSLRLVPMRASDDQLVRTWITHPHVARWFGEPAEWLDEIRRCRSAAWIEHYRVDQGPRPIGFAQWYETAQAPPGPWSTQPEGTCGIDFLIGEPSCLRHGHGRALVEALVRILRAKPGVRRVIADPNPANTPSVRTLEGVGFHWLADAPLMALDL